MAAGNWHITIEQGADWKRDIQVNKDGAAWPFTDYTIRMQVRQQVSSDTILVELTTENDRITITDAAAGEFSLALSAAETAALAWTTPGRHDLELIDPDDEVTRLLQGKATLSLEVTR